MKMFYQLSEGDKVSLVNDDGTLSEHSVASVKSVRLRVVITLDNGEKFNIWGGRRTNCSGKLVSSDGNKYNVHCCGNDEYREVKGLEDGSADNYEAIEFKGCHRISDKTYDYIAGFIGIWFQRAYFTKELWRERMDGKYKDEQTSHVMAFFFHTWMRNEVGTCSYPVGMAWSNGTGVELSKEEEMMRLESFDAYTEKYEDLLNDYAEWQYEQR